MKWGIQLTHEALWWGIGKKCASKDPKDMKTRTKWVPKNVVNVYSRIFTISKYHNKIHFSDLKVTELAFNSIPLNQCF